MLKSKASKELVIANIVFNLNLNFIENFELNHFFCNLKFLLIVMAANLDGGWRVVVSHIISKVAQPKIISALNRGCAVGHNFERLSQPYLV
jgi:hypothetical protein